MAQNLNFMISTLEIQVNELIDAMERLLENQFAYKVKDFIFKFRKPIAIVQAAENPVEPQFDENGRASVEYTGSLLLIFESI